MNKCKHIQHLLALRPQEWSENEHERVQAHLAACPECADLARAYAGQEQLFCRTTPANVILPQWHPLQAKIQRQQRGRKMRMRLTTIWQFAVTIVAVLALVFGLSALFKQYSRPASPQTAESGAAMAPTSTPTAFPSATPTLPATATPAPTMTPTPVLLSLPHLRLAYGIQAYAVGDPEQVIKAVQDLGLSWLKQEIRWFDFEPTKGEYDWTVLDALVDACDVAGIALLLNVVDAPAWARSHAGVDALLGGPPDDVQDFADLMGAIAKRYQGRVRAYEIWSEQNTKRNWGDVPPNAADYVQLLDAAYRSIKAADPSAIVVSGALAPTGVNDGKWAIDNLIYLQQMYDAGLKAACDAVGIHAPGYANPPDVYYQGGDIDPVRGYDDHPVFFFRNTVEDSYAVMDKNGDGSKRLWITRFGWGTVDGMDMKPNPGYEFTADIDEQQQAEYVADAIAWAQEWGYVEGMFLWNLNFWPIAGAKTEMAKFSIVRDDWSPRPVYTAIKALLDVPLPVGTLQGTGTFSWPTSGVLSARFGFRTGDGTWHGGLDIATHKGNEVFAADSGLVIFAGWRDGYGNIVIVNHLNGFETTYAHLDKIGASVGQSVRKGAAIGTVGETGITTGPHLHFELQKKGARVDPEAYLP